MTKHICNHPDAPGTNKVDPTQDCCLDPPRWTIQENLAGTNVEVCGTCQHIAYDNTPAWCEEAKVRADKADEAFAKKAQLDKVLEGVKVTIMKAASEGRRATSWQPFSTMSDDAQKRLARLVAWRLEDEGFDVKVVMGENLVIGWEE